MEPTKIENQFREGLKNHEILPSAAAWDRLDAMLADAEKPKKSFNWLRLVACFIGIVIISSVFYFQSEPLMDKNSSIEVVETKPNIAPSTKNNQIQKTEKNEVAIITEKVFNQNPQVKKSSAIAIKIATKITGVQSSSQPINQIKTQEVAIVPNKIEKPADDVQQKSQQQKYIDATALLSEVENKSISPKPVLNLVKTTYKMEAKALLSQVDGELDQNYRETVFQKIKKNYQTVKVAVSERNNKR